MLDVAADIEGRCLDYDNAAEIGDLAEAIARGDYPRPLVVDPKLTSP